MKPGRSAAAFLLALLASSEAAAIRPTFDLRGYVDAGLAVTDEYRSWTDGGIGKGRYGAGTEGERELYASLSEAYVVADAGFGPFVNGRVAVKFDDEQRALLDLAEAYVTFRGRPGPTGRWRFRLGTFLPPFSLENNALGWSSPYTLSSSALNSWLGEEIRINGGEFRWQARRGELRFDLLGAVFFANDPAGKVLAARGFAVHDRELGVFDRAPLPLLQEKLKNPRGPFVVQSNVFEPLHEIDGRPGYYLGLNVHGPALGRVSFAFYDNRGDPDALDRSEGHFAWDTRFGIAGYRGQLAEGLTFITQAMFGETVAGPRLSFTGKRMNITTFFTGYGLLSKRIGDGAVSVRGEYFETRDRDRMRGIYDGTEDGYAVTLAASARPIPRSKVTVELQYLDHARDVRVFGGEPRRIDELSLRINHRWFF